MALDSFLSELLKLKENTLVAHPTGGVSFGTIPDMPKFGLPGGEIYLRVGVHRGANSGFGVIHVWEAHQADLIKHGCTTVDGVTAQIAKMIVPGAQIYCEFKEQRSGHRIAVLRTSAGTLILEPRHERATGFGYYVVTWYPQKRAHGTLVGQIPKTAPAAPVQQKK
jgi:hypothetical protein